jgi:hypothetical protein
MSVRFISIGLGFMISIVLCSCGPNKAKMAEAPRVLAGFESAYLAALAEKGEDSILGENDIILNNTGHKWFKYTFVIGTNGSIIGYKATALSDIGKFDKGSSLQTIFFGGEFQRCVGGNDADGNMVVDAFQAGFALGIVTKLAPNFFAGHGEVLCSGVMDALQAPAPQTSAPQVPALQDPDNLLFSRYKLTYGASIQATNQAFLNFWDGRNQLQEETLNEIFASIGVREFCSFEYHPDCFYFYQDRLYKAVLSDCFDECEEGVEKFTYFNPDVEKQVSALLGREE